MENRRWNDTGVINRDIVKMLAWWVTAAVGIAGWVWLAWTVFFYLGGK